MNVKRMIIVALLLELALVAVLGGVFATRNVKLPSIGAGVSGGLELDMAGVDMNYDWSVIDVETGQKTPMTSYEGEVLVLNLFAVDCPPCRRQFPSLQRLEDTLSKDGLQVLAVSLDGGGGISDVREGQRIFLPMATPESSLPIDFIFDELPVTYVVSRSGRIVARVKGLRLWDDPDLIVQLKQLLAQPRPPR